MRQMQMLLFARFGVCLSQSLAVASLTHHVVVIWKWPDIAHKKTKKQKEHSCCLRVEIYMLDIHYVNVP